MDNLLKKDRQFIWHPYTQMKDCQKNPPILIKRGKGIKLYDQRGKFYYDTISSWWCNVHGHNHPRIKEAIKQQLDSLEHVLFAGFTHRPAIELAERLVSITPKKLTKVFFSDNGSTAVEVAMKISFQYWKNIGKPRKEKFISLDHGYHGDTVGAMSVSGVDMYNEIFRPLNFASYKLASPYCYRCPLGKKRDTCSIDCLDSLERLLEDKSPEISGIILEPRVLAAGGMIVYPKEYLIKAASLANKYGVHLIADEVATGFGRTGELFASAFLEDAPDLLCLSKGITSGYLPLAATLVSEKIFRAFYADYLQKKTFFHGHTYTANPLACAAGVASLKVFKEENTMARVKKMLPLFYNLMERFRELPLAGDVRYLGLIGAIELVKDKKTKKRFDLRERIGQKAYLAGLEKNIILRPLGNIIYLFLPLCIKEEELKEVTGITYAVIKSLS